MARAAEHGHGGMLQPDSFEMRRFACMQRIAFASPSKRQNVTLTLWEKGL